MEITEESIAEYLLTVEDNRLQDLKVIINMFSELSGYEPKLWGSIIGFGSLHYKHKTGHEGNMPLLEVANRKCAPTLFLSLDIAEYQDLDKLGKFKIGKSCLYINKLEDINLDVLRQLTAKAIDESLSLPFITVNPI